MAGFSADGLNRYWLLVWWGPGELLIWNMLNPSKAGRLDTDPTDTRVKSFTKREGYDGYIITNGSALVATDPKDWKRRRPEFEPENVRFVQEIACDSDVIVAWGRNAIRGPGFSQLILGLTHRARTVKCFGLTKTGEPLHPLMLRADTPLVPWNG